MSFFADRQTLDDLNIPGRYKTNSILRLFGGEVTTGGKKLMDDMFGCPLTDHMAINKRSSIFQYFTGKSITLPFTGEEFGVMENYLSSGGGNLVSAGINVVSKKLLQVTAQDKDFEQLKTEVCKTIMLLNRIYEFTIHLLDPENPYLEQIEEMKSILGHQKLRRLLNEPDLENLSLLKLVRYDYLLRTGLHKEMKRLTDVVFELDVYITVARVAKNKGFCYARALSKEKNALTVTGLYHPTVENAIGNSLSLHQHSNVIFLTGANMAGKSTLMKSFGISIYLAHMGFPVAAAHFEFSVKDGLYSSINVPDNLGMGYSHFYAEVLRVKTVAEEVAADKDLIVIFDELFKGTNVKDAYDATLSITEAFSENRNCFFIISTHIIEVGEALRKQCDNFRFVYLPTLMDGVMPTYTYRLTEGITTDRHGMMIIENEGILDIIRNGHKAGNKKAT
jgi:DNA mismatch repair protein MutS